MFSTSFGWWLFNLGVTVAWLAGAIVTGSYFVAAGALIYIFIAMLVDLPGVSSEDGSGDEEE